METYAVKDSGNHTTFETGAKRDSRDGKGRYDLISPIFLKEIALVLEAGALKYKVRNWEAGIPIARSFDSCIRHLYQHLEGQRDEKHLAHAACNLMFIIHTLEMIDRGKLPTSLLAELPESYLKGESLE